MAKSHFYEIAVADLSLKRSAVFTYSSVKMLAQGQLVIVELKRKKCFGVVITSTIKPKYKLKDVTLDTTYALPAEQLQTLRWMLQYYPFEQGAAVRLFVPASMQKSRMGVSELPATQHPKSAQPALTNDQEKALDQLQNHRGIALLHGETGTGKTRIYEELIAKALEQKRSVIILTPEISLAEQLSLQLSKRFSGLLRYHSMLTIAERRDLWESIANSKLPHIVIGPRSALFLPIHSLGLVIIDEAHDGSYKQQQSPHYSTLQVASYLTKQVQALLVYGSATPNVSDYFVATEKHYPIIRMSERPVALTTDAKRQLHIVDLKNRDEFTRNPFISNTVIEAIRSANKKGAQSLLLLNRRGTAQLIHCEVCAWNFACEHCEHSLVYHHDIHKAVCHVCDRRFNLPTSCPECSGQLKMFMIGTKFIEQLCKDLFPDAMVQRVDTDSLERKSISTTMTSIAKGSATILVGTQLLAKGLDLPLLENVVIVDAARQSNDYLGDERYYQLLHQVIGRASRGHRNTNIYLQTNDPEDPIVQWSTNEDWRSFYEHELPERKLFLYPPYCHLGLLRFEKKSQALVDKLSKKFIQSISDKDLKVTVLGPIRSYQTASKLPTWQLLLKAHDRGSLLAAASLAPSDWTADLEPTST